MRFLARKCCLARHGSMAPHSGLRFCYRYESPLAAWCLSSHLLGLFDVFAAAACVILLFLGLNHGWRLILTGSTESPILTCDANNRLEHHAQSIYKIDVR